MKILNKSTNKLPSYATVQSAGMDLRSNEEVDLQAGEWKAIGTGLFIEIPREYELQIRPRSGMALKKGITVLNTPGTIDSDYRGEIKVILINHGKGVQFIHKGDRIAQMILSSVAKIYFEEIENMDILSKTDRGEGGFGSTGTF